MKKIKEVYFCDVKEYEEVIKRGVFAEGKYRYLGAIKSFNCGLSLATYGNNTYDYVPLWIIKSILCFIEKQRKKLNKKYMLPNRDYIFYIKMFGKECLVEVMNISPIIA